jgi:hypothetical protein
VQNCAKHTQRLTAPLFQFETITEVAATTWQPFDKTLVTVRRCHKHQSRVRTLDDIGHCMRMGGPRARLYQATGVRMVSGCAHYIRAGSKSTEKLNVHNTPGASPAMTLLSASKGR